SEHLPRVARQMKRLAVVRSMQTQEGDHGRASFHMRTGYLPQGPVQYPPLGAIVSHELGEKDADLPAFVSIAPHIRVNPAAYGAGLLGPQHAPLVIGRNGLPAAPGDYEQALKVKDLDLASGISRDQSAARMELLQKMQKDFLSTHSSVGPRSHQASLDR